MVIGSAVDLCSYHGANIMKLISQSTTNYNVFVDVFVHICAVCVCVCTCVRVYVCVHACVFACACVRVRMESGHVTSYELASSPGPAQKLGKRA